MFCPRCGADNAPTNRYCIKCACALAYTPAPPVAAPPDQTLGGLIPLKNPQALTAYYLAVFSLIPCVFFLGYAAFILGILGLRFAKEYPEAKGKVHAWVGIILGGIVSVGWIALFLFVWANSSIR